jgi:hypothetical protein
MAGIVFSKSSGLNDSIYGKSEAPIRAFLENTVKAYEEMSTINKIFKMIDSEHYGEKFGGITGFAHGFQPVGEGGSYPTDERQEGYSKFLENITWKDSFAITQEMIEDSIILDLSRTGARSFVEQYHLTREKYGSQLLIGAVAGTSTSFRGLTMDCTGADGVSLFSTVHPSKTGNTGTQSNKFAGAFDADVLAKIETKMQNVTDDNGELLNLAPDTIVIPNDAALKKAVFTAIGADKDPATANNGFNYTYGRWTVIVSPYLNNLIGVTDKPFFLLDKRWNDNYNGLLFMDRIPLTIKAFIDEDTDNNVWSGRSRFVCGVNDWRCIAVGGVTGATAL